MSTPSLRALSNRAGQGVARNTVSRPSFSYGRTAAYRRIPAQHRTYNSSSILQRRDVATTILPPFALRSHFLPPSIYTSATPVRHVSFKELREQRAREKRGEVSPQPGSQHQQQQEKSQPRAAREPEPEKVKTESPTSSEADAAFASARAASEQESSKFEEAEQQEREQQETGGESAAGEEGKKEQKKEEPVEPPHGSKTPWQVFTETLSSEFKASKEWNESTKQLSGSINDFTQNPNVQRARSAYSKAAEAATTTTGKAIFGSASAIGKSAAWTWNTPVVRGVRYGAKVVGSGVEKATRPLRETEAYKNVKDVVDDGSASQRYGGWTERAERKLQRERRQARAGGRSGGAPVEAHDEDPEAGTNVTLHKDSAWTQGWRDFRDNSPVMQRVFGLSQTYRESENPLISTARSVSDRIAGFFAENETAQVIKKFREMDPSFQLEPFLTEMRTYILPEVLEAYVKGDVETLKLWLSAAQYQVYAALMQQYTTQGLQSDGRILDIRNVDILSARMLEPGEVPVFVLMARTQEVHVYRQKKTGELAAGMEDKVQQVTYAIGVTRLPEEVANPETRGWRLIELQKSGRDYI